MDADGGDCWENGAWEAADRLQLITLETRFCLHDKRLLFKKNASINSKEFLHKIKIALNLIYLLSKVSYMTFFIQIILYCQIFQFIWDY